MKMGGGKPGLTRGNLKHKQQDGQKKKIKKDNLMVGKGEGIQK